MYDAVTLDQLRALVAVVEHGSFSAAARQLNRVQSAVSTAMANLEQHLGVPIWDRSTKVATLTPQGKAVLASARRVLAEADELRALSAGLAGGLEASVSLCFDALFPLPVLLDLCRAFADEFPKVNLRIDSQVMSAVSESVLSGVATLGVVSPVGLVPGVEHQRLASISMVPVAAPSHPLAREKPRVSSRALGDAVQIVLSERSSTGVADQAVLSTHTWRVADLHTKHAMLLAGFGWGNLPEHLVREDLARRRLVALRLEGEEDGHRSLSLHAIHRKETVMGPAHRWILDRLTAWCGEVGVPHGASAARRAPRARRRPRA